MTQFVILLKFEENTMGSMFLSEREGERTNADDTTLHTLEMVKNLVGCTYCGTGFLVMFRLLSAVLHLLA